jgi:2-alkyl-3-oxoalkanoate reductase
VSANPSTKFLVTGANGFLGRYVVAEALRRGHTVRALVRSAADAEKHGWTNHPKIEVAVGDLRRRQGLTDTVRGVDAVLHLAAAKGGDVYDQLAGTVVATENLLAAMNEANVQRLVLCSTFSVYDAHRTAANRLIGEDAMIEQTPLERDGYAITKLMQERLAQKWCVEKNWPLTIIRPGVIFGRDNLANGWAGIEGKKFWIRTGANATVPVTYVENCADAIVMSTEFDAAKGETLNIVDDELPTQARYLDEIRQTMVPRPFVIPVPFWMMRAIASSAAVFNRYFCGGGAKTPSLFVPCRLAARGKAFRYTNAKAKRLLGWSPRFGLRDAIARSTSLTDAALEAAAAR